MAAPATPANVYVQQGNGQVYLSWDFSTGATSYPVLRSTDGITFSALGTATTNSYLDTTVTVGTQYWYQVEASSGAGTSPASSPQSIVPTLTGQMSLGQIRLLAQQEADRVNSNFVSTPEWNTYINQSAFELYDLLVTLYEDYYVKAPFVFTTDGVNSQYTLPTDFYKLMGVDCGLGASNNAWVTLSKFDFIERNRYVYPNVTSTFFGVFNMRYRLVGNTLDFIPVPSAGQYMRMWYIPRMEMLLKDTDVLDGVSGWTEYVVVDAAIKALEKEESDTSALQMRKAALLKRIEDSAMNRDAGQPDTISSTRSWTSRNGGGWGPGFDGGFGGY